MQNCIFCRIANGELGSQKVYEDDKVLAILDIRPVNRGHTLVITREHYENILEIPEDLIAHLYKIVKRVAEAQKRAFSPAGISVAQNNGSVAGQIIFHFHAHVIPKSSSSHERYDSSEEELDKVASALSRAMI